MFNVKEIEKCEDKNREKSLNISFYIYIIESYEDKNL